MTALKFQNQIAGTLLTSVIVAIGLLSIQVFKFNKEKRINGYNIFLPFDYKKDTKIVDEFINQVFLARKTFFRKKFMKFDEVTPSETLKANFHRLYESELISEVELIELQHRLEERRFIKGD